jgi:predicted DCC family thiol-disulfide oxidoreductase YuxK
MKTLQNHIIFYDDECPMCKLYTQAFVHTHMLDNAGRKSYQQMPQEVCPLVDMERAVNEIALIDTNTGQVTYGVASLLKVITHSVPVLKPIFNHKAVLWLLQKAYNFISYNRRVIVSGSNVADDYLKPAFRLHYRLLYLLITWLVVGAVLTHYATYLAGVVPVGNAYREYLICGGQIFFQGIVIACYAPTKQWDYLGNMMTISFAGALLLLPVMWLAQLFTFSSIICAVVFMAVAGLMFLEHVRRSKLLNLGWALTLSWVVYRVLILLVII